MGNYNLTQTGPQVQDILDEAYIVPEDGIPTSDIADGAVTEPKIANAAVTKEKLAQAVQRLIEDGYVYKNIAAPIANPGTPTRKEFWIVPGLSGTFTHFGNITLSKRELALLKWNGNSWSYDHILYIDDAPKSNSDNLVSSGGVYSALQGKQNTIPDLSDIRSGASAGATAYQKPSEGIPESDLSESVQTSLGKADTAYQKPASGIPETDLASGVQTSLEKADTAYQKPASGIPESDLSADVQTSLGKAETALQDIPDGSVTTPKIADEAVTLPKIASTAIDAIPTANSGNLVTSGGVHNELQEIDDNLNGYTTTEEESLPIPSTNTGYMYSKSGTNLLITAANGTSYTSFGNDLSNPVGIDISQYVGGVLDIACSSTPQSGSARSAVITDLNNKVLGIKAEKDYTLGDDGLYHFIYTLPSNAKYLYWSAYKLILNTIKVTFPTFHEGLNGRVANIEAKIGMPSAPVLSVNVEQPVVTIKQKGNTLRMVTDTQKWREDLQGATIYDFNSEANYVDITYDGVQIIDVKDDVAPQHILGTTIGANHGQPCRKATITAHGLTNTDIGTAWVQNGVNFYVMRIVDADNVIFLSANSGTDSNPSWTYIATGTITKGGVTKTISAVASSQLYPSLKNHNVKIYADGQELKGDGDFACNVLEIRESYDIINPSSALANTIARAGTPDNPTFDGDAVMTINNIYRVVDGLNVIVFGNLRACAATSYHRTQFSQMQIIGTNSGTKYYIPNSLPFGSYDFQTPISVSWDSSVPQIFTDITHTDDTTKPINRVLQMKTGVGMALGYITTRGTGKDLFSYTATPFELRNNTGKVYPLAAESSVIGTTLQNGDALNAVMYRALFIPETSGNRIAMYHFPFDGAEYVFADYSGVMTDHIQLSERLEGKKIEVVEALNALLLTDTYNGGFSVRANYISGHTCYIVLKIS